MNLKLYNFIMEKHVKAALEEDIGYGDISTSFLPERDKNIVVHLNSRVEGVLCGADVFKTVFKVLCENVEIKFYFEDGDKIKAGDKLAKITGPAWCIFTGERTALNYIQRMSGIATEVSKYQKAVAPHAAKIVDTRKNTPGFRLFEKYAVQTGGGWLHRFSLCDCVMLKDNHIAVAGSITKAVEAVKKNISHTHKIEVECDTVQQVQEAIDSGVDIIMLDNMSVEQISECVVMINKRALVEASGNVTLDNIFAVAATGVDVISSGSIVSNAKTLDLALDFHSSSGIAFF